MTFHQAGYSNLLARRFKSNVRALSSVAPKALAELGVETRPAPALVLDQNNPTDVVNVAVRDTAFYAGDARALARSQVEAYAAVDQSLIPPVLIASADDTPLQGVLAGIDARFGDPILAHPRPYRVPPRYAPILTVFGVGLGWHIPLLLALHDVQHLVLYESEADLLHASLYTLDWDAIVRRFGGRDRSITLIFDPDGARASQTVFDAVQKHCAALFVGSRFFRHHQAPAMEKAVGIIEKYVPLLGIGWGYFKDERRQTLQTHTNLGTASGMVRRRWPALPDARAVVVGAGPSLDAALPLLRRLRDHVVLFSCGSALRALARAGIEPDYHVELETAPGTVEVLRTVPDPGIFDRVPLIASNGMLPDVISLFRTSYLFLRQDSVSAKPLGPDDEAVPRPFPVVGNAAIGIAVAFGIRHVTLVGMDFGYRDAGRHHASGTFYVDDETGKNYRDLGHIGLAHIPMPDYTRTPHRVPSVIGDTLLADDTFKVSLVSLEALLNETPDLTLVQCGDGARISGATNKVPAQIDLADYASPKGVALHALRTRIDPVEIDQRVYAIRMARTAADFDEAAGRLKRLFKRKRDDEVDYLMLLESAWRLLADDVARSSPTAFGLLCGTSLSFFRISLERTLMVEGSHERARFIGLAQEAYAETLDAMSAELEVFKRI